MEQRLRTLPTECMELLAGKRCDLPSKSRKTLNVEHSSHLRGGRRSRISAGAVVNQPIVSDAPSGVAPETSPQPLDVGS